VQREVLFSWSISEIRKKEYKKFGSFVGRVILGIDERKMLKYEEEEEDQNS
jgi:hypothetical protein